MEWFEALLLGIIQGLTEFLPISSSGHLELANILFGIEKEGHLSFTVIVHGATVLSTIVIFWKEIASLFRGVFQFKYNDDTIYVLKLLLSMIPVALAGLFLEDVINMAFEGNIVFIGCMLLVTGALLALTYYAKAKDKTITYKHAFIIGISQAFAVLPGISRAGATISTGLLLGNKKAKITQFSFLMVLIPVIGANVKTLLSQGSEGGLDLFQIPVLIGFLAAFTTGLIACKWMIRIVRKGKIIYFSIYCFIAGLLAILLGVC